MPIILTRRICQVFFFVLFCWFCVATTLGDYWWQLRGWPVNWLLELDPLVGIITLISTGTLYAGLLWGLATVVLTLFLGRVFCGWMCPFGALHQCVGYVARRKKPLSHKVRINRPHSAQKIKYWILIFLLAAAFGEVLNHLIRQPQNEVWFSWTLIAVLVGAGLVMWIQPKRLPARATRYGRVLIGLVLLWLVATHLIDETARFSAILLSGLLDPLPLFYRSVNLMILPLVDESARIASTPRHYEGAILFAMVFFAAVALNLKSPRFFCRFVCPLGALLALLSRTAVWRIGKTVAECRGCQKCEKDCEGACAPTGEIQTHECVVCLNCMNACRDESIAFQTMPSATGARSAPDLNKREFMVTAAAGIATAAVWPLNGAQAANWNPAMVRPPGASAETEFLARCIRCGQCMRVCPTNVIQPAGLRSGLQALWTPVLNFRIGSSGCQYKCIACGHVCPTAAIRPLQLEERLGTGSFASAGPVRIGTAFIDRGRCLPWAMDTPCIVCQENCPVSPKAIITRKEWVAVHVQRPLTVLSADPASVRFEPGLLPADRYATGDYVIAIRGSEERSFKAIVGNSSDRVQIDERLPWPTPPPAGAEMEIHIRLQRPYIAVEHCIGCGVCEHECPVRGLPAVRVTAENQTRHPRHSLLLDR